LGALFFGFRPAFDLRLRLGEIVMQLDYLFLALGAVGIVALVRALSLALPLTFALAVAAVLALTVTLPCALPGIVLAVAAARRVFGRLLR